MSHTKIKKKHFAIVILLAFLIASIICILGFVKVWGKKSNEIAFNNLSVSEQEKVNNNICRIIGKPLEIKKITYNEYKNGLKNYIIEFEQSEQLDIESKYFYELDENFADNNSNTGYYYKNGTLYVVIKNRDYSKIAEKEDKELLDALSELVNVFSNILE